MIECYITACWPGSTGIKSAADQDPMLYKNMMARSSDMKSHAVSGYSVIQQHAGPVLLV